MYNHLYNLPSSHSQQDNVKHISTASEMNRANEIESSYLSMPTNHEGVVRLASFTSIYRSCVHAIINLILN